MQCYVDASFATHIDSKSHSGMIVAIVENEGPIPAKSKMKQTNTNSSCETKLVGAVLNMFKFWIVLQKQDYAQKLNS